MGAESRKKPTIITICSTKGGVGKTTLTANLGGFLASLGKRVLLVDADIQPSLTNFYALTHESTTGLVNLLTGVDVVNTISQTDCGCDLVRSDDSCGKLPEWMGKRSDGRNYLKHWLNQLKPRYDIILIDTQGAKGLLQDAAVIAADMILTPIPPDTLSGRELTGATIEMVEALKPNTPYSTITIAPLYGVLYRVDRTKDAASNIEDLRQKLFASDKITILNAFIPAGVAWREAATYGVPVHTLTKHPMAKQTLAAVVAELGLLSDLNAGEGGA